VKPLIVDRKRKTVIEYNTELKSFTRYNLRSSKKQAIGSRSELQCS